MAKSKPKSIYNISKSNGGWVIYGEIGEWYFDSTKTWAIQRYRDKVKDYRRGKLVHGINNKKSPYGWFSRKGGVA